MASSIDWRHASSFIVPVLVFLLILRRSLRERKVRTTRMWLYPVILGAAALYTMAHEPIPGPAAIASFIGAAIAGAGLSYLRARHQQFTLDAATGEISSKATPLGTILIGAFFVVRFGLEFFAHARDVPHALGLQRATDAGLIFSFALLVAQRWEILRRGKGASGGGTACQYRPLILTGGLLFRVRLYSFRRLPRSCAVRVCAKPLGYKGKGFPNGPRYG